MNKQYASLLLFIGFLSCYWFYNWWIRMRFIVDGYIHSGSFFRKLDAIKKEWNWVQRIALIPLLSNKSSMRYHWIALLNYTHLLFTIYTLGGHLLKEYYEFDKIDWQNGTLLILIVMILEIVFIVYKG